MFGVVERVCGDMSMRLCVIPWLAYVCIDVCNRYYFTHELAAVPIIELASKKPFGVFHGSELALVFGAEELLLLEEEKTLSRQVAGRFICVACAVWRVPCVLRAPSPGWLLVCFLLSWFSLSL